MKQKKCFGSRGTKNEEQYRSANRGEHNDGLGFDDFRQVGSRGGASADTPERGTKV
jgi:hypothetical protein